MVSVKEVQELIGKEKVLRAGFGTLYYYVTILDVRECYGKVQCEVTTYPNGCGKAWVNLDSLLDK